MTTTTSLREPSQRRASVRHACTHSPVAGQRALNKLLVGALCCAIFATNWSATSANASPSAEADVVRGAAFELGAGLGYSPRFHPDRRTQGANLQLWGDSPLFSPFGLRVRGSAGLYTPSELTPASLIFIGGAFELTYAADELDVRVVVSAGPFAGVAFDGALPLSAPHLGVQGGVGLRFPLGGRTAFTVDAVLPFELVGPSVAEGAEPLAPVSPHLFVGFVFYP